MNETPELRVLVCAPTGRDGPLICAALARAKLQSENLATVPRLCAQIGEGVGAVIAAEEALDEEAVRALVKALGDQPPWSDVPVLLLTGGDATREVAFSRSAMLEQLNVTLVERPLSIATFLAAVRAALRARGRQYAMRETLRQVEAQSAELRQAAVERTRLLDSERRARQLAEEANRAKDDFLAVISHELRTPLSAILGWTTLLGDGRIAEEKRAHAVRVIDRNARAQAQLIEDLLDVSRITSGKLKLEQELVDPAQIVHSTVETVKLAADARGITLEVHAEAGTAKVRGDAPRLQQVIWNLLHNAIKFTPPGGQVQIELAAGAGEMEVTVRDTGRGIPAPFLPFVFDRFRQAETPTTRSTGGLGLGLAICRHIVELHGGTIAVASDGVGRGSTFTVRLPLARPVHEAAACAVALGGQAANLAPTELTGVRVLLVDDDADTRELLRAALEMCKAEVSEACNAAEALLAVAQRLPDVLVSDIAMPDEDGYSLIRKLRQRTAGEGGALPAVALTAFARDEDRNEALEAGFQVHLAKPIEPDALLRAIADLVTAGARVPTGVSQSP